jgi:glycosyltransferase involved in cell wall biosynthesis
LEDQKKKLRVLTIISSPQMGGIESQLLLLLERYDRERFVIDVACGQSVKGALRQAYDDTDTRLHLCRWSRWVLPFIWRVFRLARREKYDVVHPRLAEVSGAAIFAARLAGVSNRIASYEHTKTHYRRPGLLNRMAVRLLKAMTNRWATTVFGDAEVCLDVYHPHWREHRDQFDICYDGIDLTRFEESHDKQDVRSELGLPAHALVVGHVGRFNEVKNHRTIVEMARNVTRQVNNSYFLLVGDGPLRPEIEQQAAHAGLTDRVLFAGIRDDVPRMLSAMDVFVMPSLDEGFGLAVAEAQLCSLPVVASDIPGIREGLHPDIREFCREPRDAEGMAEHVVVLLRDPDLRRELGRKGHTFVTERFSIEKTVEKLQAAYDAKTE